MIQNLVEKSPDIYQILIRDFNLIFITRAQLTSMMPESKNYFREQSYEGDFSMYILFVKHGSVISIMHKLHSHDISETTHLYQILNEYLGLFAVTAEEDQGYR